MQGVIPVKDLIDWFVTVGSLCTAIFAIVKMAKLVAKPNKEQNERIEHLEKEMVEVKQKLNKDYNSMGEQQEINTLNLKSLHALLSHALDGNNTHEMEACKEEIQERLFREGGSIR